MENCDVLDIIKKSYDEGSSIAIVTHTDPDPDTLGSATALSLGLKKMGVETSVICDKIKPKYLFLKNERVNYKFDYTVKYDLVICIDVGALSLVDYCKEIIKNAKTLINIDHHISNEEYGDINIVNSKSSSAAEMTYHILGERGLVDKDIAECIYAGIIFDTSGFKHVSTSPITLKVGSKLLEEGIDFNEIYSLILSAHSSDEIKVFSTILDNCEFRFDNKLCYSVITYEESLELNVENASTSYMVSYLLRTNNVDSAFIAIETEKNQVRASLRSKESNVNEIAALFGGGGHIRASGMKRNEAVNVVVDDLVEQFGKIYNEK